LESDVDIPEGIRIDPDLEFIRSVSARDGPPYKPCFQCGTCSATCALSPDSEPFPRRQMAWAVWGMRERLLASPEVWLCHHCNDCSTRCPRGARPGDVLAAVRRECVQHYAAPRFLGRWVNQPHAIPLLLGIPVTLLALALAARSPIERALGLSANVDDRILYAYSSLFPHWMINALFGIFSLLAVLAMIVGGVRFWRAMKAGISDDRPAAGVPGLFPSILSTLMKVISHRQFTDCTKASLRYFSHLCVFYGFLALTAVTLWVITARYNPLVQGDFIYPFDFWSPWKILANLGGVAFVTGCLLMAWERLKADDKVGSGTWFDWALLAKLLLVAVTGFITEILHYLRLEPHRHIAYFVHLVFVFVVLVYLPYSKFAHVLYRFTAMVFAEYTGRGQGGKHDAG